MLATQTLLEALCGSVRENGTPWVGTRAASEGGGLELDNVCT